MGRNKDFSMFSPNPVVPFRAAVFRAPGGDVRSQAFLSASSSPHVYRPLIQNKHQCYGKATPQIYTDSLSFPKTPNENKLQNRRTGNGVSFSCCRKNGSSEMVAEITVFSNTPAPH